MNYSRRGFLAGTGIAALTPVGASAAATGSWSVPRGDTHNTGHASLRAAGSNLQVDWKRSFDADVTATPTYRDGRATVGIADGGVVALEATTGAVAWTRSLDETPFLAVTSSPDRLLVPTMERGLYSLDPADGGRHWRYAVGERIGSPVTTDGDVVLLGTEAGTVVAIDAGSGERRWTGSLPAAIRTVPAIVGGAILVRDGDGVVAALDRATGEERWRRTYRTGLPPGAFRGPVIRDGTVFTSAMSGSETGDRRIVALDLHTGSLVWERPIRGAVHQLVSTPDTLFSLHGEGVNALDPADGSRRWLARQREPVRIASVRDALYVASSQGISVRDPADGSLRDRIAPGAGPFRILAWLGGAASLSGGPTPIPGGVLVPDDDGTLWAVTGGGIPDIAWMVGGLGGLGAIALAYRYRRRGND